MKINNFKILITLITIFFSLSCASNKTEVDKSNEDKNKKSKNLEYPWEHFLYQDRR